MPGATAALVKRSRTALFGHCPSQREERALSWRLVTGVGREYDGSAPRLNRESLLLLVLLLQKRG